jgi:hypothetical protein
VSDKLFNRTGVRYEVACDVIGALISHYAALIATEEDKDGPDQDTIVKAGAAQKALRDERDALPRWLRRRSSRLPKRTRQPTLPSYLT